MARPLVAGGLLKCCHTAAGSQLPEFCSGSLSVSREDNCYCYQMFLIHDSNVSSSAFRYVTNEFTGLGFRTGGSQTRDHHIEAENSGTARRKEKRRRKKGHLVLKQSMSVKAKSKVFSSFTQGLLVYIFRCFWPSFYQLEKKCAMMGTEKTHTKFQHMVVSFLLFVAFGKIWLYLTWP